MIASIVYGAFTMYVLQGNKLQLPAAVGGIVFLITRPPSVDTRGHGAIKASGCTQDGCQCIYFKNLLI